MPCSWEGNVIVVQLAPGPEGMDPIKKKNCVHDL
jgi:hypothetical protein